ncbi:Dolichyl-diphosphooligosaccharide--protein glycosyltransferase subunit WBP1 [Lineolata rhizophorae]|uniref:Dolichyl-diphosphooligosaccharide--protein glycosyltransferase subunit WBP1 n=1 Tax=Lineolata rhizophorae TaxID=578093 RepID=A0A6A6NR43_9PEZI|nr:Dolichyl-diphosphooligosaccharide--protein glycosyltransferase subunit WBP1 [Lineolata rhizophorae]
MRWLFSLAVLALASAVSALSAVGNRLLVVLEEESERDKYSNFWADLEARGYDLTFKSPKSTDLSLFQHGVRTTDHLLILPPKSKGLGPALTAHNLLDFLSADGNILLTLSGSPPSTSATPVSTPSAIAALLLELDLHLPPDRSSLVVDHFSHDVLSSPSTHDTLVVPGPAPLRPAAGDVAHFFDLGPDSTVAVPRAVGHTLGATSPLIAPVLLAPRMAYAYNPADEADAAGVEEPFATGRQLALASAFQARNSARLVVLGSAEMLADQWTKDGAEVQVPWGKKTPVANRVFARKVSEWVFKEVGVLKVGRLAHWLNEGEKADVGNVSETGVVPVGGEDVNPKIYRIKNDVTYAIELSEYSRTHWKPFYPPGNDRLQLEFSMLSPFHRLDLVPASTTPNSTLFTTSFTLPDQHGIFNFRVNYKRPFLTNVDEKRQVTVRHFAHDEWPRSFAISGAWVWIGGIWVTVAGWVGFVALWLYSKPAETKEGKKTK